MATSLLVSLVIRFQFSNQGKVYPLLSLFLLLSSFVRGIDTFLQTGREA